MTQAQDTTPWEVVYWFEGTDGQHYWMVEGPRWGYDNSLRSLEEARLIAAAPDMLAALEAVLRDYRIASLGWPSRTLVENVIAKAKGEA